MATRVPRKVGRGREGRGGGAQVEETRREEATEVTKRRGEGGDEGGHGQTAAYRRSGGGAGAYGWREKDEDVCSSGTKPAWYSHVTWLLTAHHTRVAYTRKTCYRVKYRAARVQAAV